MSLFQQAFEQADAGMALLAPGGEWLTANAALCRRLERPAAELLQLRAHEVLFDAATARRIESALAGEGASRRSFVVDRPGGQSWRMSLARLGADADAALLLEIAADDNAVADRVQEHLAHGISHDLRAPLRGIAGFAARLAESGAVAGTGMTDLERIRAAALRAEHLVDGLLELLRASRQPLRDGEVDISLLCDWVAGELRDADPAREARIDVPPGLQARGDEHWLKAMLGHLLHNAWKFSATCERVDIRIEGSVADGRLLLAIHDGGCGFDMRYADKLFVPFQRLHGAEQGGGNGLGLAISRQVAERHGGRLWGTSRAGEGSTFFIELPAAAGREPVERHDA